MVLTDRSIAPIGTNLTNAVALAPELRGAPPKNPAEINKGARNNPKRILHVATALNLESSRTIWPNIASITKTPAWAWPARK